MAVCACVCRGFGHTTAGGSLLEAAARALHWWEVVQKQWGTAFTPGDDEIIRITVTGGQQYSVRVGRVRQWAAAGSGMVERARLRAAATAVDDKGNSPG